MNELPNNQKIQGMMTKPVKLRDGQSEIFNMKQVFGFVPENVIVVKVAGKNNWYQLMGQFTPEELEKHSRMVDIKPEQIKANEEESVK